MTCEAGTSDDQIGEALLVGVVRDQVKGVSVGRVPPPPALPEVRPINELDQKLVTQLANTIKIIGDQLDKNKEFNDMIDGLERVADKSSFWKLVEKVFNDGQINWGRIIVLFYSVGKLAAKMVIARLPGLITDVLSWAMDYFRRNLLSWIRNMGGWINSISELARFSMNGVSSISIPSHTSGLVLVFLSGVLLGSFVAWRLGKNS